jgi:hypothetical protein
VLCKSSLKSEHADSSVFCHEITVVEFVTHR